MENEEEIFENLAIKKNQLSLDLTNVFSAHKPKAKSQQINHKNYKKSKTFEVPPDIKNSQDHDTNEIQMINPFAIQKAQNDILIPEEN